MWPLERNRTPPPGPQFRVSPVFDVIDRVRGPLFLPGRPLITDPGEIRAFTALLDRGESVLPCPLLGADVITPERTWAVPLSLRTNGRWIWCEAAAYYLQHYGIAPDPHLLRDLRAPMPGSGSVDRETLDQIRRFLDCGGFQGDALAAIA